jgi:alpha-L-rhamnosidase
MVEPNRVMEAIKAARVEPYLPDGWVIDMGRDFTGWLELKLPPVPSGAVVKLEYSDQMEPDKPAPGTAATSNASSWDHGGNPAAFPNTFNQRDEIVGNGEALTFRSRFNYHGFRYVRVTGIQAPPNVADANGLLIRTAYERAGEFTSSNSLLNRIYQMTTRTYEALTLGGYVVDCPTRERLGYGGDAGTSMETGMFNFATGGLYNRWLANWRDAQDASGSLPHTAPNYPNQGGGGPMWGGFVATLPWQMYLQYGDKGVLETNYPTIRKWLHYLASETTGGLLLDHKSHAMAMQTWNFLGDWLTPKGSFRGTSPDPRPAQLVNSAHYLYQLQTASKIAAALGKEEDASAFRARGTAVAQAIHEHFYDPADSSYGNGDSFQEAFPLLTGAVPAELRGRVAQTLEDTIRRRNGGHLDTGMHGTYFLLKYLMETGRNDLIYGMTNTEEYPGWGYMLANGATTSWEGWTGQSHIHDTLISIGAWFIEGVAGIRSDGVSPGFQHFVIAPAVGGGLTFAKARYHSIRGDIVSDWRIENGKFELQVTVPPGSTATVYLPGKSGFEAAPGTHSYKASL